MSRGTCRTAGPARRRLLVLAGIAAAGLLAGAGAVAAGQSSPAALKIERAWARATPPGTEVGAVYFTIRNPGRHSDRLLGASTPRAARVEFHATIRDVNVVRMQRVDPVHVAARGDLTLEPGGLHAMLLGLRSPLREGERFPMTLLFERGGRVQVEVRVAGNGAVTEPRGRP